MPVTECSLVALPKMSEDPEGFIKWHFQMLKTGFEQGDSFDIVLSVPAPSGPEEEENENDEYINILLSIINMYCEAIGFIDQSSEGDGGKEYVKLKISCSNWEGWTTYKKQEKQ